MEAEPIVSIVDDDQDVRQSLEVLLHGQKYSTVSYSSAEEFLNSYNPESAGCILLDVRMPGMDGLELQGILNQKNWKVPVIIMTGHADVAMAVEALSAGASAFIEKPFRRADLIRSIERALAQDQKVRDEKARLNELNEKFNQLTPRELEITDLVVAGHMTKQIASELQIGDRTVETHRRNLMRKLDANSVAELVSLRLEHRTLQAQGYY
ncbi:MAG: response regulator transcription factor [Planctomycetales bacterium]|nr:response regulator transcription factor [Planctomycetales bacterium]